MFLILAPIYRITFIHAWIFFCSTGICFAVCFYQWISYIQKVKFRIGELSSSEHEKSIAKDIKQVIIKTGLGFVPGCEFLPMINSMTIFGLENSNEYYIKGVRC